MLTSFIVETVQWFQDEFDCTIYIALTWTDLCYCQMQHTVTLWRSNYCPFAINIFLYSNLHIVSCTTHAQGSQSVIIRGTIQNGCNLQNNEYQIVRAFFWRNFMCTLCPANPCFYFSIYYESCVPFSYSRATISVIFIESENFLDFLNLCA